MSTDDTFYENTPEDTHCVQACYQMLVARSTGQRIDRSSAEKETGYAPGLLTWQFALLYGLAENHGLYVVDHEDFHPESFLEDPEQAIRDQLVDSDAADHQIQLTDLDAEVERLRACIRHPRIEFRSTPATFADMQRASRSSLVTCVLNGASLYGEDHYRPHSVVLRSLGDSEVELDDPGPPANPRLAVSTELFLRAWLDPDPNVANFIACSRTPIP